MQVERIHDLLDISTLRCAKEGVDCTTKSMIWNLSQNVDRYAWNECFAFECIGVLSHSADANFDASLRRTETLWAALDCRSV